MINSLVKRRLEKGEVVIGTFVKFASANLVEMIGLAGFDFIIIDTEHANFTHGQVEDLIRAAQLVGMSAIVRTGDASEAAILHALDSGASGVQVPSLGSATEAATVIRRAKYHPLGERGWAPGCRAGDYAFTPAKTYIEQANRDTLVAVHVENARMAADIDALCALDQLDVAFIGTGDLSQSLGHPGEPDHPDVAKVVDEVVAACARAGKHYGVVASSPDGLKAWVERGARYIAWQSDMIMYKNALKAAVDKVAPFRAGRGEV
ncbi:HpcH/HpaI aldolase/citrate lyase family protein [Azospirillum sp. B4]|uniref:HpcH/HpaI aldolase family protein n=1 Tax=Azospirillum sp. B4 TaxID=95605 RepID=UPI00034CB04D|nr:aldolase/citrate lyase family protein [Azospirillum sp. B4]